MHWYLILLFILEIRWKYWWNEEKKFLLKRILHLYMLFSMTAVKLGLWKYNNNVFTTFYLNVHDISYNSFPYYLHPFCDLLKVQFISCWVNRYFRLFWFWIYMSYVTSRQTPFPISLSYSRFYLSDCDECKSLKFKQPHVGKKSSGIRRQYKHFEML